MGCEGRKREAPTKPRQPGRHADGLVGACRNLRPPRAASQLRTRSARLLAGDAGHRFLRRWRGAGTRRDVAALMKAFLAARPAPRAANYRLGAVYSLTAAVLLSVRTGHGSLRWDRC